jgi:hypothetical protein|tara:strand:- start:86 stop:517 length:432 start_codon:yes stop_codon:yes gene_type:complete
MIKKLKIFNSVIALLFILSNLVYASNPYFNDAKNFYNEKKFQESKFLFEKNIVFNPKSEKSYLYLAKIFKEEKNDTLEENNLNTVLLLNPRNEEAIYLLALLKIKNSDFSKAEDLIKKIRLVCKEKCIYKEELEIKLNSSIKK